MLPHIPQVQLTMIFSDDAIGISSPGCWVVDRHLALSDKGEMKVALLKHVFKGINEYSSGCTPTQLDSLPSAGLYMIWHQWPL